MASKKPRKQPQTYAWQKQHAARKTKYLFNPAQLEAKARNELVMRKTKREMIGVEEIKKWHQRIKEITNTRKGEKVLVPLFPLHEIRQERLRPLISETYATEVQERALRFFNRQMIKLTKQIQEKERRVAELLRRKPRENAKVRNTSEVMDHNHRLLEYYAQLNELFELREMRINRYLEYNRMFSNIAEEQRQTFLGQRRKEYAQNKKKLKLVESKINEVRGRIASLVRSPMKPFDETDRIRALQKRLEQAQKQVLKVKMDYEKFPDPHQRWIVLRVRKYYWECMHDLMVEYQLAEKNIGVNFTDSRRKEIREVQQKALKKMRKIQREMDKEED